MSTDLPRSLKVVTVWLLIGLGVFLAIQTWQHEQARTRFRAAGQAIEIRRSIDGHYHWPGRINGRAVDFLIDTGATGTAIPAALVRELKLASIGRVESNTAGGRVIGDVVRADVALDGGVSAERLRVVALPALGEHPLLGMDVLGRLHWQQRDGVLRIELESTR
jgi:aspartyl protease family protein